MVAGAARIIVVEDNDIVRGFLAEILTREGYEVAEATGTDAALALLDDAAFSLVLTDVDMPGRSGLELLDEVRRLGAAPPVLLISGLAVDPLREEALARGAAGLIAKPCTANELLEAVAGAISAGAPAADVSG